MATLRNILLGAAIFILPLGAFADTALTHNLRFGMYRNREVVRLQDFLRSHGYLSGPSTGNYLNGTIAAVKKFQQAHGLSPIGGYFGSQSRRVANEIMVAEEVARQKSGAGGAAALLPSGPQAPGSATTSPYKGKIFFDGIQSEGEAGDERITIGNRTDHDRVSVTGFSISTERGQEYVIPVAFALPGFSATPLDPIVLDPHERAVITAGKQDQHINFRENLCTGYFDEQSRFSPGLSHRCPAPDTRTLHDLSDECVRVLNGIGSCRTGPLPEFLDPTHPECAYYIAQNLNYAGCAAHYRSRPDFYGDQWLVWMQRAIPFFNKRFDTVVLKDAQGKTVDQYQYGY